MMRSGGKVKEREGEIEAVQIDFECTFLSL